jgi:hypothetical protein
MRLHSCESFISARNVDEKAKRVPSDSEGNQRAASASEESQAQVGEEVTTDKQFDLALVYVVMKSLPRFIDAPLTREFIAARRVFEAKGWKR